MISSVEALAQNNASTVQGWALTLFGLMATLEIILVGMSGLLGMSGLDEMIGRLFKRLVLFSVLATAILSYDAWFPPIMDTFRELGKETTGFDDSTTVGDVLKIGWDLMQATHQAGKDFVQSADSWYTAAVGWYFSTPYLTALFVGILFWMTFGLLSLQFFYVQMEAAIATYIGMVVLGFSAFRGTASLAENYVAYLLRVGIKLFLIYFLIGLFEPVAASWVNYLSPGPSASLTAAQIINRSVKIFIGAVLFTGVALSLPSFASRRITEGFSLGLSRTLSN